MPRLTWRERAVMLNQMLNQIASKPGLYNTALSEA